MGCPYYRYSSEDAVPWPHIDNPLRNPSPEVLSLWEQFAGGRDLREEVRRLGLLDIPEADYRGEIVSNSLHKPSRTTYCTHIPLKEFPLQNFPGGAVWRVSDPSLSIPITSPLPGYALLREIRIRGDIEKVSRIDLKLGFQNKVVQSITEPYLLARFLKDTLGIETITGDDIMTLPFFFSRDSAYSLPMFVVGKLELLIYSETPIKLYATFDLLHTEEEISQIQRQHIHRVEDMDPRLDLSIWAVDRWLHAGCFWQYHGFFSGENRIDLNHEGGVDEELRGVFWQIMDDGPPPEIGVGYSFEPGCEIFISDLLPEPLLSELELKTKIIPTLGASRYIPRSERGGRGGILFSRAVDSLDCEPGLTPRNGTLFLSLSRKTTLYVFLLTSRDILLTKYG